MSFFNQNTKSITFVSLLTLITSCASYRVTLNEARILYEPPTIFTQYSVVDAGLQRCLDATIEEGGVTLANQLITLVCTYNDIRSLEGLEQFPELTQINFSNNAISDLSPLTKLTALRLLLINDNKVTSLAGLQLSDSLQRLELMGNDRLDCESLAPYQSLDTFLPPAHCQ